MEAGSELLALSEKSGDMTEVAVARCAVARARALGGSLENAMQDASDALTTYRARGNLKEQGATLLLLAEICNLGGQSEDAERKARAALNLFKEVSCWRGAAAALEVLVQLYNASGQFKAAKSVAKDELDAFTGRDKHAEATAVRLCALAHLVSDDLREALRLADEGLRHIVALGDRGAEAALTLTLATTYASMGQSDDAVAVAKRAHSLFRKLGSRDGEKASMQVLAQIHGAKGMEPPSSPYRAESLSILQELGHAVGERDAAVFQDAVLRLSKLGGFFTKKDLLGAVGPLDQEGVIEFFRQQVPSEVVDIVLQSAMANISEDPLGQEKRNPLRFKETDKLMMYGGLRVGNLVYGPRFRQIEAFVPYSGYLVVHSIVRPSSLCDDWEQEGWDWNPAVIDAGAHAGFALQQVPQ